MKSNWTNPIERWKSRRNGILLEFARDSQGRPARLPQSILSSHALVIGEAEEEKRNFLTQLACFHMKAGRSMIVVDADGTLVDALMGRVPRRRVPEVIYLDLGDDERIVHYNPIQMKRGSNPKAPVASIVRATRRVWSKYWDMDVEGLLNAGVSTLATINQVLAERGQPQFSLGDLPYLFHSETMRRRLLNEFITDPLLTYFWMGYYERDLQENRAEKFLDCLGLVNNSILPHRANLILSQSSSSLDWNEILCKRCIIFMKTDAERSRWENQHWPAACLLEQLLSAVQEKPTNAKGHPNEVLPILVSGLEPLIYPDRIGMLEELTDRGVTFTFTVSSLAELDKGLIPLTEEMLSQAPNIFAFSLTPADAEILES